MHSVPVFRTAPLCHWAKNIKETCLLSLHNGHCSDFDGRIFFRNQSSLLTSNLSSIGLVMCLGNLRRGGLNTGDKGDCFSPSKNTNTTSVKRESNLSFTITWSCLRRVKRCNGIARSNRTFNIANNDLGKPLALNHWPVATLICPPRPPSFPFYWPMLAS